MDYYRPPTFSLFPPVVKNLLIANVVFYIATLVIRSTYHVDIADYLGLHYFQGGGFKIYQLLTYLFLHDTSSFFEHPFGASSLAHIFFNMFALWMFGNALENLWGWKKFLIFYLICGIGAGITQEVVQYFYFQHIQHAIDVFSSAPNESDFSALASKYFGIKVSGMESYPGEYLKYLQDLFQKAMSESVTIGASGAIFGVLLAFGMTFPNTLLYVYFAIPVKAKYFVVIYGLLELFSAAYNKPGDNVAHYAHLGGMIFGFIVLMYWRSKRRT
jgi:membrane associated rhomboid family serine protease